MHDESATTRTDLKGARVNLQHSDESESSRLNTFNILNVHTALVPAEPTVTVLLARGFALQHFCLASYTQRKFTSTRIKQNVFSCKFTNLTNAKLRKSE